jgi:signal transduction histidine kinase
MLAEVLIYVPLVANYRVNWLRDHLEVAKTAALVLEAAPNGMVPDPLAKKILDSIGARAVAMKMGATHYMLQPSDVSLPPITDVFDMRQVDTFTAVVDGFRTMLNNNNKKGVMRVVGPAPMGGEYIDLVMDEQPLRAAMLRYSADLLLMSLLISGITAALVYLALHYLFVRPMRRITDNMMAFRADPENPDRIIAPSTRVDELGLAERELSALQTELASMLHQKNRLAALGLAVSKINHDLRNLLATAQLFSDRLANLPDPTVQRFAPKLMQALERAIAFCQSTLSYGRLQEPPPDRRPILLEPLVEEVHETLNLGADAPMRWISAVERGLTVEADYDQLFRILLNLARNAVQAMESRASRDPGRDQIRITGRREGAVVVIEVSDTGPGFSDKARAHLFEAFQGSTRTGGAGLGLAIAAELVRAHGGDIRLVEGTIGATLRLTIPDRAVELSARRGARAHG